MREGVLEFSHRATGEARRWHRASAGLARRPLAVPASICHQQEHLQPKVPLSTDVRVTHLAFPLVQGPCLPGRCSPKSSKKPKQIYIYICILMLLLLWLWRELLRAKPKPPTSAER